jgi:selenocysteine-specific elongation factor
MRVIGTAGHVDHGKSTLVQALTGIDPDRLKEEKQRQMTIDLGFAWYDAPELGPIGIVDVPGHRDFIENMLAGVGGIDAVLLVIAADEGVMPQTREHLAIIDLLKIKNGLVVLTKIDMVEDPDWIDLVELDVKEVLRGTSLEDAPILRVSALTGKGIQELKTAINSLLLELGPRIDRNSARLAVDRVFSITGFGTVVTGTLVDGSFRVDELVEVLPTGKSGRIRGLQSHKKKELEMLPGTRTAMNLAGIDVSDVKRGDTIVHPGQFTPSMRIDARLDLLTDAPVGLKHNDSVKLFHATTETMARIRLLQKKILEPGNEAWVQIETEKEVVIEKGDRFIIRRVSPAQTIGGGTVVDPHPARRYKLNDPNVIARLDAKNSSSIRDRLMAMISEAPFIRYSVLSEQYPEDQSQIRETLNVMVAKEEIKLINSENPASDQFIEMMYWREVTRKAIEVLESYHNLNPLRIGMTTNEFGRRIRIIQPLLSEFTQAWECANLIKKQNDWVSLTQFEIRYSANQAKRIQDFTRVLDQDPFTPPNVKEARTMLTDDVYQSLLDQSILIQISPEVVLRSSEYKQMADFVMRECAQGAILTLAQFRDHFSTSRKYSQAFLEHLDSRGVTERVGEGRKLKNGINNP